MVRSWPIFERYDDGKLIEIAQDCQQMLHQDGGLGDVLSAARKAIPEHLHDTAYALAFDVATADLEMRMEELRVLQRLRQHLAVDAATIAAMVAASTARCWRKRCSTRTSSMRISRSAVATSKASA